MNDNTTNLTIALNDFDGTLKSYLGADLGNTITQVLTWVMVAFAILAVVGAVVATIFHRLATIFSLDGDMEKFEKAKKVSKHIWISVAIIVLLCVIGPGAIWIVLGNMTANQGGIGS